MPTATANGIKFNYQFDGPERGPVVVLCNSLATDLRMWEPTVPALTGAGYRVLRYDRRGHGKSEVPKGAYTLELLAADALGLLDALQLQRVHYCGLSIGGMVGQILGAEHGERLASLTLCDTSAHMVAAISWDERIEAVRKGGMAAVLESTMDRWVTKAGQQRLPHLKQLVTDMILGTPVDGYCGCIEALKKLDNRARLPKIKTPTAIIVGEEDLGTPVAASEAIHAAVAGSKLTVLPSAGHLSNLEQAEGFNAALLAHLKAHNGA